MSYESALIAAGCKIVEFKNFGSYQGDWYAMVEVGGEKGILTGSYGSCSGCDAFEAELGWGDEKSGDYQKRLCDFGKTYLPAMPSDHFIAPVKKSLDSSHGCNDEEDILEFLLKAKSLGF